MKRGKVVKSEGISMSDGKMMKNIEQGGYKYLGILEADGVKHRWENVESICRVCGAADETVAHIVSECSKLAQEYKQVSYDNIAKMLQWKLCEK